jgi:hypothetical protein
MATLIHCRAKKHYLGPQKHVESSRPEKLEKIAKMGNHYESVEEVGDHRYPPRSIIPP